MWTIPSCFAIAKVRLLFLLQVVLLNEQLYDHKYYLSVLWMLCPSWYCVVVYVPVIAIVPQ